MFLIIINLINKIFIKCEKRKEKEEINNSIKRIKKDILINEENNFSITELEKINMIKYIEEELNIINNKKKENKNIDYRMIPKNNINKNPFNKKKEIKNINYLKFITKIENDLKIPNEIKIGKKYSFNILKYNKIRNIYIKINEEDLKSINSLPIISIEKIEIITKNKIETSLFICFLIENIPYFFINNFNLKNKQFFTFNKNKDYRFLSKIIVKSLIPISSNISLNNLLPKLLLNEKSNFFINRFINRINKLKWKLLNISTDFNYYQNLIIFNNQMNILSIKYILDNLINYSTEKYKDIIFEKILFILFDIKNFLFYLNNKNISYIYLKEIRRMILEIMDKAIDINFNFNSFNELNHKEMVLISVYEKIKTFVFPLFVSMINLFEFYLLIDEEEVVSD